MKNEMTVFLPSITVAVVTATPPSILDILLFLSFLLARPSQNVFYYTIYVRDVRKKEGWVPGYLHDTGSNPVSVEQTLRVSSDLK